MKLISNLLTVFLMVTLFGYITVSCKTKPKDKPKPEKENTINSKIDLPDGFEIGVFAENVDNARSLELSSEGTLFVGSRDAGNVYALKDTDGDFKADKKYIIAEGLNMPNGVAMKDGNLYVAEIHRVIKFENIEENLDSSPEPVVVNDSFPDDRHHGWKYIAFGPDGKLYIPVGAPCNICDPGDPYASITRMNPDGSDREIFARGIRNTVGFDWHPETKELWFTDNGRDMLGDNRPPDELNHAPEKDLHFGYPYCHGKDISDPKFGEGQKCSNYRSPARELGPHVASLGMEFYEGDMFPSEYKNQIFIAEHGSWNRTNKIGYRITLVKLDGNKAKSYETFASGWLVGEDYWGRPVDLEVMSDGSMLVSDDYADKIYRISLK